MILVPASLLAAARIAEVIPAVLQELAELQSCQRGQVGRMDHFESLPLGVSFIGDALVHQDCQLDVIELVLAVVDEAKVAVPQVDHTEELFGLVVVSRSRLDELLLELTKVGNEVSRAKLDVQHQPHLMRRLLIVEALTKARVLGARHQGVSCFRILLVHQKLVRRWLAEGSKQGSWRSCRLSNLCWQRRTWRSGWRAWKRRRCCRGRCRPDLTTGVFHVREEGSWVSVDVLCHITYEERDAAALLGFSEDHNLELLKLLSRLSLERDALHLVGSNLSRVGRHDVCCLLALVDRSER
ncbi:hypothetical protein MPSEU_000367000 [Mayamaea pseudoterrestris]|nr:hypothetical protein MPSEU_000367000 [Mayamaea pseudoterrestris]